MNTAKTAEEILASVGGKQNVASLVHCATRLRFKIKNKEIVDSSVTKNIDGVITVVESGGQYQVIIGNRVSEVFNEIQNIMNSVSVGNTVETPSTDKGEKESLFARTVDIISGIFTPFLGALAAAGILKGMLLMLSAIGVMSKTSGAYIIWFAAADSIFYFLPMAIAVTSAKKFGANIYVALSVAGALIYPSLITMFANKTPLDFFSVPVVLMQYTSSVIPVIFSIWLLSILERKLNRVLHDSIRNFINPLICMMVIVPVTLMAIGPMGIYLSLGLANGYAFIYNLSPVVAGVITGVGWQYLVIFGLHWAFVPIMYNNIAVHGYDTLKPLFAPSNFAQAGAALGVFLKTKNPRIKQIAGPAAVTGLFGIVEPIIYGISLRYKKPFLWATIGGGVGGGICGFVGATSLAPGIPGLATLPTFYGPGFTGFIFSLLFSFTFTTIMTYFFGFNDDMEKEMTYVSKEKEKGSENNYSKAVS
ncbi:PTS transporter subunit EIIC [Klebsiella pneumoniae]|uniref:PTS transporter subunit EIIC n=1 Tax=Klebsiella pneumoniae TaxID=573 RepID=UPI003872C231